MNKKKTISLIMLSVVSVAFGTFTVGTFRNEIFNSNLVVSTPNTTHQMTVTASDFAFGNSFVLDNGYSIAINSSVSVTRDASGGYWEVPANASFWNETDLTGITDVEMTYVNGYEGKVKVEESFDGTTFYDLAEFTNNGDSNYKLMTRPSRVRFTNNESTNSVRIVSFSITYLCSQNVDDPHSKAIFENTDGTTGAIYSVRDGSTGDNVLFDGDNDGSIYISGWWSKLKFVDCKSPANIGKLKITLKASSTGKVSLVFLNGMGEQTVDWDVSTDYGEFEVPFNQAYLTDMSILGEGKGFNIKKIEFVQLNPATEGKTAIFGEEEVTFTATQGVVSNNCDEEKSTRFGSDWWVKASVEENKVLIPEGALSFKLKMKRNAAGDILVILRYAGGADACGAQQTCTLDAANTYQTFTLPVADGAKGSYLSSIEICVEGTSGDPLWRYVDVASLIIEVPEVAPNGKTAIFGTSDYVDVTCETVGGIAGADSTYNTSSNELCIVPKESQWWNAVRFSTVNVPSDANTIKLTMKYDHDDPSFYMDLYTTDDAKISPNPSYTLEAVSITTSYKDFYIDLGSATTVTGLAVAGSGTLTIKSIVFFEETSSIPTGKTGIFTHLGTDYPTVSATSADPTTVVSNNASDDSLEFGGSWWVGVQFNEGTGVTIPTGSTKMVIKIKCSQALSSVPYYVTGNGGQISYYENDSINQNPTILNLTTSYTDFEIDLSSVTVTNVVSMRFCSQNGTINILSITFE